MRYSPWTEVVGPAARRTVAGNKIEAARTIITRANLISYSIGMILSYIRLFVRLLRQRARRKALLELKAVTFKPPEYPRETANRCRDGLITAALTTAMSAFFPTPRLRTPQEVRFGPQADMDDLASSPILRIMRARRSAASPPATSPVRS